MEAPIGDQSTDSPGFGGPDTLVPPGYVQLLPGPRPAACHMAGSWNWPKLSTVWCQAFPWKLQPFKRFQSSRWFHQTDPASAVVTLLGARVLVLPTRPSSCLKVFHFYYFCCYSCKNMATFNAWSSERPVFTLGGTCCFSFFNTSLTNFLFLCSEVLMSPGPLSCYLFKKF